MPQLAVGTSACLLVAVAPVRLAGQQGPGRLAVTYTLLTIDGYALPYAPIT